MKKTLKKPSLKTLKDKADKLFSQYIRLKNSRDGKTTCFTCHAVAEWKEHQCGHFVSRTHLSTRWDEENVRVQCFPCNIWRRGNYDEFARNLVKEKGPEILEELNRRKNETKPMKKADYEILINELQLKLKQLP